MVDKFNLIDKPNASQIKEFNEKVQEVRTRFTNKTKVPISNPQIKRGKVVLDFQTPRMIDLKNPRNKALLNTMNNLVKQSGVKFKGIDQELMFANTMKERFNILRNAGIDQLKNSKYIKAFAQMSGDVGKHANTILKTKTGKIGAGVGIYSLLSSIASASEKDEKGEIDVEEMSMVPEFVKKNPWTSAGVGTATALTQKPVRSAVGKAFRTLGTPLSGLGWAGWTAYDNLKSGKSLTESVVDPLVGMELTFPSMFKENISKITKRPTLQKVLGLGKFGSRFMPGVGTAITLGSLTRDSIRAINKESQRIDAIEDPDQQAEEQEIFIRNIKGYAGGGLANLTRTVAPDSGPMSQGLRSLYIDDMD